MQLREDRYPEDDTERARVKIQEEIEQTKRKINQLKDTVYTTRIFEAYLKGLQFALDLIGI